VHVRSSIALALGLACGALVASAQEAGSEPLPPIELVRAVREGRIALRRGQDSEGLRILREAAEAHPHDIVPMAALWEARDRLPASEQPELRRLLTARLADPESPLPAGTLDYLLSAVDDTTELAAVLDAATRRLAAMERPNPRMLEAVASIEERLGRVPDARKTWGRLLELEPGDEGLRWHCAMIDVELERLADAASGIEKILTDLDPAAAFHARIVYIDVLARLGRIDDLSREIDGLMQNEVMRKVLAHGFAPELLLDTAWTLRDEGKDSDAEAMFRRVLALDPKNEPAHKAMLHLYADEAERKVHRQALEAMRTTSDDPDAWTREAVTLLTSGDAAGATVLLERAAAVRPDSELVWYNLGLAALRLKSWDVAERACARALEINPDRAATHLNHAVALEALDRCPEVIAKLDAALVRWPDLHDAHAYLYRCHSRLGHADAAAEHLRLHEQSR
jgi:tetratricopeptide (TPR) repeat protein